jgi:hypothetical protein
VRSHPDLPVATLRPGTEAGVGVAVRVLSPRGRGSAAARRAALSAPTPITMSISSRAPPTWGELCSPGDFKSSTPGWPRARGASCERRLRRGSRVARNAARLGQRGRSLAQIAANPLQLLVIRSRRSGRPVAVSRCKLQDCSARWTASHARGRWLEPSRAHERPANQWFPSFKPMGIRRESRVHAESPARHGLESHARHGPPQDAASAWRAGSGPAARVTGTFSIGALLAARRPPAVGSAELP